MYKMIRKIIVVKTDLLVVYFSTDTLWVEVTVESEVTMALAEQMAALPVPSSRLDDTVPQVIKII